MQMITTNTMSIKTYSELCLLPTYRERYQYLRLDGQVGVDTFGYDRYLNQLFYRSPEWKRIRDFVILRDNGCDLGLPGYEIYDKVIIHHMNPITVDDIRHGNESILDPEFLVCVTHNTHNAIHYGDETLLVTDPVVRTRNDTCPWRL
mgnify:CR=1 FL=1